MRVLLVLVVSLVGCRGPLLGSPCDAGAPQCTGAKTAAFCEPDAGWVEYAAPGGCTEANGVATVSFVGAAGARCPDLGVDIGVGHGRQYAACDGVDTALICPDPANCILVADGGVTCGPVVRVWESRPCDACSTSSGLIACHPSDYPVEGRQCPPGRTGYSVCDSKTTSITCADAGLWLKTSCPGGCKDLGTNQHPTTTCS
jgi:hypothetical protein